MRHFVSAHLDTHVTDFDMVEIQTALEDGILSVCGGLSPRNVGNTLTFYDTIPRRKKANFKQDLAFVADLAGNFFHSVKPTFDRNHATMGDLKDTDKYISRFLSDFADTHNLTYSFIENAEERSNN